MRECGFITSNFNCAKLFTPDESQKIISLFNSAPQTPLPNKRFIYNNTENKWFFEIIGQIADLTNKKYYNFILAGLSNYAEIVKYQQGDSFDWTKDIGPGKFSTRKISIMLFLSESAAYEGGLIKWFNASDINNPDPEGKIAEELKEQEQGNIIMYPSYKPYKLEALNRGEKYVLTAWAVGDHFF